MYLFLIWVANFYPRSPCGERLGDSHPTRARRRYFYPRSPCGERPSQEDLFQCQDTISIHALLAESDAGRLPSRRGIAISIHALLAESDSAWPRRPAGRSDFYPRSPCGERPLAKVRHCEGYIFLSTLSLRRATVLTAQNCPPAGISIHALLAESDHIHNTSHGRRGISIHALLAESDHGGWLLPKWGHRFLSTLSLRRATASSTWATLT